MFTSYFLIDFSGFHDERNFCVLEATHEFGWAACPKFARADDLSSGHERSSSDHGVGLNNCTVHDTCLHADEGSIMQCTRMNQRRVTDGAVFSDLCGQRSAATKL